MFILTQHGKEDDGAYSVTNAEGNNVLYLFDEEDDAMRYAMMLEDENYPEMHVIEVDAENILKACEVSDTPYALITSNDIVVPPRK